MSILYDECFKFLKINNKKNYYMNIKIENGFGFVYVQLAQNTKTLIAGNSWEYH